MSLNRAALIVILALLVAAAAFAQGQTFEDQNLRDARFVNCDLQMAKFTDCRLLGAHFVNITQSPKLKLTNSRLDDSIFEDAALTDARWTRVTVDGLEAYDLTAEDWEIEQSELTELTFERSYLRYIELDHCDVRDFESGWSSIPGGRWQSTDLSDGDFQGCDFSDGSFYRGSFEDAEFRNVDFSDVRLENCDISGLVINGVCVDELID
jgi:uncharacterized protein YjbI with pentapeptide repeats